MSWLAGYTYRKEITLNWASGLVTDYQMLLLLGESSGATGEAVDCGAKCKTDFSDIRFTTADGTTLLNYWIEEITGATPNQLAKIWIKFDSIGTEATTFYMYYGNSGASAVSNGANTFITFDDFERGNNGDAVGGDWNDPEDQGDISTDYKWGGTRSQKVSWYDYTVGPALPVDANDNISVMFRAYKTTTHGVSAGFGNGTYQIWMKWDTDGKIYFIEDTTYGTFKATAAHGSWHLFEFNKFVWASKSHDFWLNGSKIVSMTKMKTDAPYITDLLRFTTRGAGHLVYIDNVIVRNWRETEPAWGAWGSEEEGTPSNELVIKHHYYQKMMR